MIVRLRRHTACTGVSIDVNDGVITALASIAVAFFTYALRKSTDRLWDAGERQSSLSTKALELASSEFIATHRPKIIIRNVHIPMDWHVGERLEVLFYAMNIGESQATIKRVHAEVRPYRVNTTIARDANPQECKFLKPLVKSGDFSVCQVATAGPLQAAEVTAYSQQVYRIAIVGWVLYADDNGLERTTGFARYYDVPTRRFIVMDDSDYEYAY